MEEKEKEKRRGTKKIRREIIKHIYKYLGGLLTGREMEGGEE